MNFNDTLKSVELIIKTDEVPLVVGESGIGKTSLAKQLASKNNYDLIVIDGNLLKEGEIGGLPTVEEVSFFDKDNNEIKRKVTTYAIHTKLREIDESISKNKEVLLFIDEINRCEHSVQQELMNLILNREINGYKLHKNVKILSAMNPSNKFSEDYDYQVVDMDKAQENRFVWLNMEADYMNWILWATNNNIEKKVIDFIVTFPEYLHKHNEDDISATPRSYERLSKIYALYKNEKDISKNVFLNVVKGNVGKVIAQEFVNFVENDYEDLISFDELCNSFDENIKQKIKNETHTRLYINALNILKCFEESVKNDNYQKSYEDNFIEFLSLYPIDLMVGIMKEIKNSYSLFYNKIIENEKFVELYFNSYKQIRG